MNPIGVLGGTFDPVHYGHLASAQDTLNYLSLDRIIFVPAAWPPHKAGNQVQDSHHRAVMVKLAIEDNEKFELSTLELERPGPSYTIATILDLKSKYIGQELYFILGFDAFLLLSTWKDVDQLAELCRFAVLTRPGYELDQPQYKHQWPKKIWSRFEFLSLTQVDISSSELRRRVAADEPISGLVPPKVEQYIKEHKLYVTTGDT